MRAEGSRSRGLGLLFLTLTLLSSCAEPEETPAPVSPFAFEPARLDLGTVIPGGSVTGTVLLRNITNQSVTLSAVNAPCECTLTEVDVPRELGPGEEIRLPIEVDLHTLLAGGLPPDGTGPELIEREIVARTNDGREETLPIVVEVSDLLTVTPARAIYRPLLVGKLARVDFRVAPGRAGDTVSVHGAVSSDPSLEVEATADGGETTVSARWGPFQTSGPREAELTLITGVPGLERVRLPFIAEVISPIRVRPERIRNEEAIPNKPLVTTITLLRASGEPLRVTAAETTTTRVVTRILRQSVDLSVQHVQVTVVVPPYPRVVEDTVTLRLDDDDVPVVTVPLRVRERPP